MLLSPQYCWWSIHHTFQALHGFALPQVWMGYKIGLVLKDPTHCNQPLTTLFTTFPQFLSFLHPFPHNVLHWHFRHNHHRIGYILHKFSIVQRNTLSPFFHIWQHMREVEYPFPSRLVSLNLEYCSEAWLFKSWRLPAWTYKTEHWTLFCQNVPKHK